MKKIHIIDKPAVMMTVLLIIMNVIGTTACGARQTTENTAEQSTVRQYPGLRRKRLVH